MKNRINWYALVYLLSTVAAIALSLFGLMSWVVVVMFIFLGAETWVYEDFFPKTEKKTS